jgi:hypothetical protein
MYDIRKLWRKVRPTDAFQSSSEPTGIFQGSSDELYAASAAAYGIGKAIDKGIGESRPIAVSIGEIEREEVVELLRMSLGIFRDSMMPTPISNLLTPKATLESMALEDMIKVAVNKRFAVKTTNRHFNERTERGDFYSLTDLGWEVYRDITTPGGSGF